MYGLPVVFSLGLVANSRRQEQPGSTLLLSGDASEGNDSLLLSGNASDGNDKLLIAEI